MGNADWALGNCRVRNTGFESAWLNNRIFLDVDLYFSKTTDQIFERNIPVMTGFKTIKSSLGQINNRGVEITLRTMNITKQDFTWMISYLLAEPQ